MDLSSPWSDPQRFFDGLGPNLPKPSAYLNPSSVRLKAFNLSNDIFDDWVTLFQILTRHENVIRHRWGKKSREQRKRLLLKAWPNMTPMHRPDYKVLEKEGDRVQAKGQEYRGCFMWPYINLEDLVEAKSLLLFLNSRGRSLPEAFANSDLDAAHMGIISFVVERPFINQYTMSVCHFGTHISKCILLQMADPAQLGICMDGLLQKPMEKLLHGRMMMTPLMI